jgi:flagellar motility protein MotE (MotC chaperone)
MSRLLRDFRLIPIVLFATISLFALKTIGLVIDGHYTLDAASLDNGADFTGTVSTAAPGAARSTSPPGRPPADKRADMQSDKQSDKQSWAQQMFSYPDITGAVGEVKPSENKPAESKLAEGKPAEPKDAAGKGNRATSPEEPQKGKPGWTPVPLERGRPQSPAETAILERLQERRAELDARAKELDMRESLLKAAEKRLEGRIAELKDLEARINNSIQQRDDGDAARFKNVVTMYESMKAKDAAKIFDRLELKILVEVASLINPRRMSDILAQMQPDAAQQLTVELAARSSSKEKPAELPKIEGKPTN